ncbi:ArsR/SmtB family transcription factor [Haloferula rosea]|uniref:Winged helix-turn-helix transcriptional regulator n=1 Tax=Haloferula rosea TaxID=490093 RepID=A0A934R972_9BACT|nr:metalloregulator ArsR/SmtB family transcription factor [Haloferula rosea]MBK1826657.1 winged helix-turn-helix transcriptional regulator [Haloferula rosea]
MPATTQDPRVAAIKALAHPTRLRIAEALASGPLCVSEIHALTDADLSTVSKHLTLMRKAGWLACEKDGLHIHYRLACECLPTFLSCIDSIACDDSNCC